MNLMKRLAVLAALALALSGCAVTGQAAGPGVAATYGDHVVTQQEVADLQEALVDLQASTDSSSALTILLLEPTVLEWAADAGFAEIATEEVLTEEAIQWRLAVGADQVEVTDEMRDAVNLVLMTAVMAYDPDGAPVLVEAVNDIAERGEFSPAYGDFTMEHFQTSIAQVSDEQVAAQSYMGPVSYRVFNHLTGFPGFTAPAEWMSTDDAGEGVEEPVTAP